MLTELSLQVLLALAEGPAHGYAIGKEVQELSNGRLNPTTGSLYQTLKRLTESGFIRHVVAPKSEPGDSRRKYFTLTNAGRRAAGDEIHRLEALVLLGRRRRLVRENAG